MRFSSQPDAVRPTVFAKPPAPNAPRMINFTGIPEGMQGNQYYGEGLGGIDDQRAALAKAAGQGGAIGGLANVKEPLGGIGYMLGEFENAFGDYRARQAEAATRNALAQIMGGIDPTKGPTQQDIQAAMQADPAYGTKLYEQLVAMQNKERWEPVPGQPGLQRSTLTGETKKTGLDEVGGAKLTDINSLRGQFEGTSAYKNLANAHSIWANLVDTAGRDTGASDLNFIYGIAKIFDPTSVVREGELQMAQGTGAIADMIRGLYKKAAEGKSGMSTEVRQSLLAEARTRMKGYRSTYQAVADFYTNAAVQAGMDPTVVVQQFPDYEPPKEDPDQPKPDDTGDVVEADTFPASPGTVDGDVYDDPKTGSHYVAKDGVYVKQPKVK